MCSFFPNGPRCSDTGRSLSNHFPSGYEMRMMKKEEKDGAFDLKKKSCEILAPKMHKIVPRIRTRGVRVGREVSSVSGTTYTRMHKRQGR